MHFWIETTYVDEQDPSNYDKIVRVAQNTEPDGTQHHYYWNSVQKKWIETCKRNSADRSKMQNRAIYFDVFARAQKNNWSEKQIEKALEKKRIEHEEEQIRREIFGK